MKERAEKDVEPLKEARKSLLAFEAEDLRRDDRVIEEPHRGREERAWDGGHVEDDWRAEPLPKVESHFVEERRDKGNVVVGFSAQNRLQ